jgi:hypothetical protein
MSVTLGTYDGWQKSSTLLTGLVSYWKLDESSGTLDDAHGSNDGTSSNLTYSATGKINTAVSFNGSSSYIGFGNPTNLRLTTAGAISCWVYAADTAGPDVFINKWDNGTTARNGYAMYTYDGYVTGHVGSASSDVFVSAAINANTWYHVVVTWNASTIYIYRDGSFVQSKTSVAASSALNDLEFGRDGDANSYYQGRLDEVAIYNRLLTSDEVTTLYNSGSGKAYPFS